MNRADLLHSVLKDGRRHSRRDIFDRVGFMLTNNAASELRARGVDVTHTREGRVDFYSLNGAAGLPEDGHVLPASPLSEQEARRSSRAGSDHAASTADTGPAFIEGQPDERNK